MSDTYLPAAALSFKSTIKALEHGLKPGSKSIETLEQHHK